MSDSNEQKPAGYGHDQKGAAGGAVKNEGRVHVTHSGPMQGVADRGGKPTAKTFTIDDREIDIRDGETIFRAARRLGVKLPHLCY
jgi:formate dehydrogenase major subunit